MSEVVCWIFGHRKENGIVATEPFYTKLDMTNFDPPSPNHGEADFCTRCHKVLSEITWEYK